MLYGQGLVIQIAWRGIPYTVMTTTRILGLATRVLRSKVWEQQKTTRK